MQDSIAYQQIEASGIAGLARWDNGKVDEVPFKVLDGMTLEKKQIFDLCVKQIKNFLTNYSGKNGTPLIKPSDIAILVAINDNGEEIRQLLSKANIPSTFVQGKNIYETDDAWELYWVLKAIDKHNSRNYVFNALATPICGKNCCELYEMQSDSTLIENEMIKFEKLKVEWKKSFLDMFQLLLKIFDVRVRYLAG